MKGRDYLDDMLYRAMPRLDQAMQECLVREQENTPLFRTSGRFERNMRRLLQKAGQRDVRNREGTRLNGAGRALPGRTRTAGRTGLSGRRLLAAVIFILAMLALGLTAGAAILRRIELIHYRDEVQGADVYRFSGEKAESAGEVMIIYPSYIPDGYAETGNVYQGSPYYELEMEWTGPEGDTIRYTMFQTMEGGRSIYLDADYDSEEQVMVNGNAWFCTYREGAYRMARLQKGDLFFLVSTEDTFPREELIKILEGIQLPEQTEAEVAAETEDSEELHARIGELERQAEEWAMEDRPFLLEGDSEDSPENEAGDREASGGGAQAAVFGNKDQAIARRDQALDFIRQRYPDYLASTEQMEEGILQSSYLRAVYGDFQTPRPEDARTEEAKYFWTGRLVGEITEFVYAGLRTQEDPMIRENLAKLGKILKDGG